MRRFIARENIRMLEAQLTTHPGDQRLQTLLDEACNELSRLEELWRISCPQIQVNPALGRDGEDILDGAVAANHADFGSLQLFDHMNDCLALFAQANFDSSLIEIFPRVRRSDGSACAKAWQRQDQVIVKDVETDGAFVSILPWTREVGIRSIVACPIIHHARGFAGCYSLHFRHPLGSGKTEELMLHVYQTKFSDLFSNILQP